MGRSLRQKIFQITGKALTVINLSISTCTRHRRRVAIAPGRHKKQLYLRVNSHDH